MDLLPRSNSGQEIAPADDAIDPRSLMIAARGLDTICAALGRTSEAEFALAKKAGGERMMIRNLWLWAMRPHIPRTELCAISKLNPKTITTYQRQIDEHADRNGLLYGFFGMIADLVEPLPGLVDDSTEALADMAVEAALDRARKAVDGLAR